MRDDLEHSIDSCTSSELVSASALNRSLRLTIIICVLLKHCSDNGLIQRSGKKKRRNEGRAMEVEAKDKVRIQL